MPVTPIEARCRRCGEEFRSVRGSCSVRPQTVLRNPLRGGRHTHQEVEEKQMVSVATGTSPNRGGRLMLLLGAPDGAFAGRRPAAARRVSIARASSLMEHDGGTRDGTH